MQSPRQEQPEVRIQLQRIAFPSSMSTEARDIPQQPQVQIQRVPLGVALQRAGITADDLKNIQRMAEERIQQELRDLASDEDSSEEDDDSDENHKQQMQPSLPYGRIAFGRSLIHPVDIPVSMNTQEAAAKQISAAEESERPHCKEDSCLSFWDVLIK